MKYLWTDLIDPTTLIFKENIIKNYEIIILFNRELTNEKARTKKLQYKNNSKRK